MTDTHAFCMPRPCIAADDPWQWLATGWRDKRQAPIASVNAVCAAPFTMLVCAWLIVVLTVCGLVTACLGLIVTFPLVGHAKWHTYSHVIGGVAPGAAGGAHPVTSSS